MMKYFFAICMTALLFNYSVFSQEKTTTHKVQKGETINQIAQKYNITPFDIYQLNPDAQSGLKPNSVLLIPKGSGKPMTVLQAKPSAKTVTHEVMPKETLYGIEKKYGVSDEALKQANPFLEKEGLQIGQTLVIPSNKVQKNNTTTLEKVVYHYVLPKETKYSISKQYGITIEELERKNPEVISNLPEGYKLLIKGIAPKSDKIAVVVESKKEIGKPNPVKTDTAVNYLNYEVKPKETLYSLSKMAGMTQEELITLNPVLSEGVVEGMILKVPATITTIPQETKKEYTILSKKMGSNDRKKLVLFLPFNMAKIEGDTVNSTAMRLKKDKFLNMTLDFYSGALMAIDSAKQMGLSFDVKIFDSQETKNTSNVASLIKENNLEDSDAIIGPFYQNNVEKTAELLNVKQVPVISPLSKDLGNSYSNLFQTIPTAAAVKNAVFDYMRAKGGNIIAVVDKKKESVIQYIKENHKDIKFSTLTASGGVSAENLKSLFVKDKINYVVMETGNTGMIKSTMAAMLSAMAAYKVQLVILEPNETLDTDEINFVNLTKLKLMYPSVTRENESPEALIFEKEYRKRNKIFPSAFATRGFDITFDTMMRLSQDKTYQETADAMATEQVDNKFEYYKKEDGGYTNKGVHILYYDTDLTIKEAN
ncbi:PBP1 and LysM peptidoglycan-binding domain-containing protein [Flavobacterium gawalongense]|uniref:LysM peptidoglycan-binding domain-containing protein n=1 Tax=Flavobacterium gawalongense TaxID=2594432 RepID=A0A553BHE2_9FLAO|nr:LysM peptidoglycan-binding domain-containing protein [Flavobacterium gawalongense]TRX03334.1 LysM peptidoglycan-binding domain-containing protein [Flavobacterium gawalongense]TRX04063.1 LysM peptidoglycan-binding domain-containing protein [Flavobacterium gawalongense]TRX07663.1 LysM peptidoglycan-binding domain-containing protein [Flavobacterium gawalongense]TRX07824.1 LysM peptidoglycan-binding domain-containing protein [Flavobacterium gawalongense]TRX23583.1 LysM peptidoglycan-binding dom